MSSSDSEYSATRISKANNPEGAFGRSIRFIRLHWPKILCISVAVLIPCFWHRRIEAGDLGSHLYNAWLAQMIERGEISGLWIATQHTNVLFDLLLAVLARILPLLLAAKIIAALSVLIFFWSTFALVSACTGRAPWTICPVIAMVCYGWTFNMGFLNYYISLALSFIALALILSSNKWERASVLVLAPIIILGHPLGFVWLACASVYILFAQNVSVRHQLLMFFAAFLSLLVLRNYLWSHYVVHSKKHAFYLYNGIDQFVLFGPTYKIPAAVLAATILAAITIDLVYRPGGNQISLQRWNIFVSLYVLVFAAIVLLPDSIKFPRYDAPLSLLSSRLTSISAVVICCIAGFIYPRKWHIAAFSVPALAFFSLLYVDTGRVNRIEDQADALISSLPPGQRARIIVSIPDEPKSRLVLDHIVDSACIGRCFTYGNYEPSSGQFRVRALPGNRVVTSDYSQSGEMSAGKYIPNSLESPLYQISVCGWNGGDEKLCMRQLAAADK